MPIAGVSVRAWKPPVRGIREVFHARFTDHAYPRHTHDVWTLFIVDDGAIRYDLHGQARGADPSMVTVLPPHVVHDGRPATSHGFRKRVLYLETSVLGEHLIGPAVDRPVIADPTIRAEVSALHDTARAASTTPSRPRPGSPSWPRGSAGPRRARRSEPGRCRRTTTAPSGSGRISTPMLFEPVTMAAASDALGLGPTQLARSFARVFGIAPHAYLIGRRLEAARDRILGGQPLADVAADVGFCDQAHLTRRFKQFLGTTPGRFASALDPVPLGRGRLPR